MVRGVLRLLPAGVVACWRGALAGHVDDVAWRGVLACRCDVLAWWCRVEHGLRDAWSWGEERLAPLLLSLWCVLWGGVICHCQSVVTGDRRQHGQALTAGPMSPAYGALYRMHLFSRFAKIFVDCKRGFVFLYPYPQGKGKDHENPYSANSSQ